VVEVLQRFGIGQIRGVAPDLQHDLFADLALERGRQFLGTGFAQRRQVDRLRACRQRHRGAEDEGNEQYGAEAKSVQDPVQVGNSGRNGRDPHGGHARSSQVKGAT
jgi:hypothetical protein